MQGKQSETKYRKKKKENNLNKHKKSKIDVCEEVNTIGSAV